MKLRFGTPDHGWLPVEISGEGGSVAFDASDVPGDSLAMLADAAGDLVSGGPARDVVWFLEPAEDTWSFQNVNGIVDVRVRSTFRDEVCIASEPAAAIGWAIWRALRRLRTDPVWTRPLEQVWSRPFPERSMDYLHGRLIASKESR